MAGLYRSVTFKVFSLDCKTSERVRFSPPDGAYYTQDCFDDLCADMKKHLEDAYPKTKFRFVQVGKNQFNVVPHLGHA